MSEGPVSIFNFERKLRQRAEKIIQDGHARHDPAEVSRGELVNKLADDVARMRPELRSNVELALRSTRPSGRKWRDEVLDRVLASKLQWWPEREVTVEAVAQELYTRLADSVERR